LGVPSFVPEEVSDLLLLDFFGSVDFFLCWPSLTPSAGLDDVSPAPFGIPAPVAPGAITSELEEPAVPLLPALVAEPESAPVPCANATEDIDTIDTNDKYRMVDFNVMSSSFSERTLWRQSLRDNINNGVQRFFACAVDNTGATMRETCNTHYDELPLNWSRGSMPGHIRLQARKN
jgi:hypothetical protein